MEGGGGGRREGMRFIWGRNSYWGWGGGEILYFQRGEGGSEGNLTESDVKNPIWNWEGYPDQSKNPIITKVGKGVISFEKKKTFDIFITLAC